MTESKIQLLKNTLGLSPEEVLKQRALHGTNSGIKPKNIFLQNILSVAAEPMFILLLAACGVYLFMGEMREAITMLAAILFVAGIDLFQNFRSQRAVKTLSRITAAKAKVIRSGTSVEIPVEEIVVNDIVICEEGTVIPADAEIISSNDFSVNEAVLTGESVSVEKFQGDNIMQGTLVVRGYCYAIVHAVGKQTALAGIGKLVADTMKEKTPLQIKVSNFLKIMVIAGGIAFAFVWAYHWWESGSMLHGLLHALTMAMSVLPEEIPVALSAFMALGAYRLLKHGVITHSPKTVETLGSATVICVDKTGTLTQNLMNVSLIFSVKAGEEINFENPDRFSKPVRIENMDVLEYAMWASEENPFDPMEQSIHKKYSELFAEDRRKEFKMVKEFPLSGNPPVMTHIFRNEKGETIIGCKGGLEGVLNLSHADEKQKAIILKKGKAYGEKGLRVLGVAKGNWHKAEFPQNQEEIKFTFLGIITFYDPPDPHIASVIHNFHNAGVDVKMITGDYPWTARSVAEQTGIKTTKILSGNEISEMSDGQLMQEVGSVNIFARVSPENKLRIINALKEAGEIVAMTGDGVNDAPALKAAHIGISMGKRGTEAAKAAAGLVLSGDDLSKMTEAIFIGRRINENLTKAIRYIISIHIPIIFLVIAPIFFGWLPSMLFMPVHVIFLELLMGPTCSVVYENDFIPDKELRKPFRTTQKIFFSVSELSITILQGLLITAGCLVAGWHAAHSGLEETKIRSSVFAALIFSNVLLTLVNRSFRYTILKTIRMKNILVPIIISVSLLLLFLILFLPALNSVFSVSPLSLHEFIAPLLLALGATCWVEFFKIRRKEIK